MNSIQKQLLSSKLPVDLNDRILDLPELSEENTIQVLKQLKYWTPCSHEEHTDRVKEILYTIYANIEMENHKATLRYKVENDFAMFWFLPIDSEFDKLFEKVYTDLYWTSDGCHNDYYQEIAEQFNMEDESAKLVIKIFNKCNIANYRSPKCFMQ